MYSKQKRGNCICKSPLNIVLNTVQLLQFITDFSFGLSEEEFIFLKINKKWTALIR